MNVKQFLLKGPSILNGKKTPSPPPFYNVPLPGSKCLNKPTNIKKNSTV